MKIDVQLKQKVENNDNNVQLMPEDMQMLSTANAPFSDIISSRLNNIDLNSESLSLLSADYNYDSISMDIEDALFFINLAHDGQFSTEVNKTGEFQNLIQTQTAQSIVLQKTVEVTNNLTTLIEKAQKTQKPVRITFDNNVSVILKVDKNGKVTAEFIPGSAEAENYLRNNIVSLRQKFDEQNLPYNDLFYRQNSRQNKNRDKERGEQ